ncbi:hypothetical protein QJS04_geneDACA011555 [Acorus gramineus]|uniref:Uncharacterized protein n=1 Tax=Acorus gramineus TaxID=55184 RepID=A0AAV9ABP2_ACOGR|nr:hypothetical protein QJS04_geneDACA011555 [Acorus gramineus]
MRVPTSLERGVSPAHLGLSSRPSSFAGDATLAFTVADTWDVGSGCRVAKVDGPRCAEDHCKTIPLCDSNKLKGFFGFQKLNLNRESVKIKPPFDWIKEGNIISVDDSPQQTQFYIINPNRRENNGTPLLLQPTEGEEGPVVA